MSAPAPAGPALRPAVPADRAALVRLQAAAFPGSEAALLGPRYVGALFDALLAEPGSFVLLVELDGAPAGFVAGSPFGAERARYRRLLPAAAAAALGRPSLLLRADFRRVLRWRLASLGRATGAERARELAPPVWLLDLVGVEPAARGRGAGERLMAGFADAARERGARSFVLWVRRDAAPARRLYERCGWREAWPVEPDRVAYARPA